VGDPAMGVDAPGVGGRIRVLLVLDLLRELPGQVNQGGLCSNEQANQVLSVPLPRKRLQNFVKLVWKGREDDLPQPGRRTSLIDAMIDDTHCMLEEVLIIDAPQCEILANLLSRKVLCHAREQMAQLATEKTQVEQAQVKLALVIILKNGRVNERWIEAAGPVKSCLPGLLCLRQRSLA